MGLKEWFLNHEYHRIFEIGFLHLGLFIFGIIVIIGIFILKKILSDIKESDKKEKKRFKETMKNSSNFKKEERKRLKF